jgi:hypothetical protein
MFGKFSWGKGIQDVQMMINSIKKLGPIWMIHPAGGGGPSEPKT